VEVVEDVVSALRAGQPVILPTDTVYGLCASPFREADVQRLYRLKGRADSKPTALLCSDVPMLFECLPTLRGRAAKIARALLPGPYTLVLPNPSQAYPWLSGSRPNTLGVRVPSLEGDAREVLEQVGALAATSANVTGGPEPRVLADVPEELRAGCGAVLDGGKLPGMPSTVLDVTGKEPRVLREGAARAAETLERVRAAVGRRE
jgi:L-threonylcarbamoyladenylate synthase